MWFKNKNIKNKNKNMRCAKQTWKWIFLLLTHINMNMEKTRQGYGAKSCLKLILKKFKEMRGLTFIYTPMKT